MTEDYQTLYCLCMQIHVWYQYLLLLMLVNCLYIYTIPLIRWLVLFAGCVTGWSSIQLVIGCNKSGTNPLLAWAPPPLAGRSSFLSSFMACQQLVKFILLYFWFVLTCPASVMLMCCVCLCSCFCQAGPSYLTPPLPVYIAITCWRTLNQSKHL